MIPKLKSVIPILLFYNLDYIDWTDKDRKDVLELVQVFKDSLEKVGHTVISLQLDNDNIPLLFKKYSPREYIVFNWCEGIPGINHSFGKAAKVLEELGFYFTGSSSTILELNDDKRRVKDILSANMISTPRWIPYENHGISQWQIFPSIVKPAFEHCSVGIGPESIVDNYEQLTKQADYISEKFEQPVIIEEYIEGREFQVGVWGNEKIEVFPPVESDFSQLEDPRDHICTMDSKDDPTSYRYQKWNMIVPANLSQMERNKINQLCERAYQTIGVRDYARMDIRYGKGTFYLLDVNTNPYIGPECGLIQAASLLGYSYGEFGSRLINFALERMKSQV